MRCARQATLHTLTCGSLQNPEHHSRMKHVERRHLFIRECVENMQIVVPFVSTHDNLADLFTKPLAHKKFFALRDRIMNHSSN